MDDPIGKQFGPYRLLRLLGRGGFGSVYLGEHVYLETSAAVKLHYHWAHKDDHKEFLKEAQLVAALKHPHIVKVFDFGIEKDIPFFVMEYAPHGTLRQMHLNGTRIPLKTIVHYVNQLADALDYAHQRHVIHRDVKPENMLVGDSNEIWLSDFGIAIIAKKNHLVSTQNMAGTPLYMAPEQMRGKPQSASDQYSLGIVVYEWLCGVPPFKGASPIDIIYQHIHTLPPHPHEHAWRIRPVRLWPHPFWVPPANLLLQLLPLPGSLHDGRRECRTAGGFDQVSSLLRDHDRRGIGIAVYNGGHNGSIHDPQTGCSPDS